MLEKLIEFSLNNFTVAFMFIGFIVATLSWSMKPKPVGYSRTIEIYFANYLLFGMACSYLFNFIMHVFFSEVAAKNIGFLPNPFQNEVGFANFSFALLAFIAYFSKLEFRSAAVIAPSIYIWGAAIGQAYQIFMASEDYPLAKSGSVGWIDLTIPLIGFLFLWLQYRNPVSR